MGSIVDEIRWQRDAACIEHPELNWLATGEAVEQRAVCAGCLVRDECLAHALVNDLDGVWGGTTLAERRRLRSRRR